MTTTPACEVLVNVSLGLGDWDKNDKNRGAFQNRGASTVLLDELVGYQHDHIIRACLVGFWVQWGTERVCSKARGPGRGLNASKLSS